MREQRKVTFLLGFGLGVWPASFLLAGCLSLSRGDFVPYPLPQELAKQSFSFSGSGELLGFCTEEKGKLHLRLYKQTKPWGEFFLSPPGGEKFRSPRCTLWNRGESLVVEDKDFFAVYAGSSLVFWREKPYQSRSLYPAVAGDNVFWSPHPFELNKERSTEVVRQAEVSSGRVSALWSFPVDWSLPSPALSDLLDEHSAFAVPGEKMLWVAEYVSGSVYLQSEGKTRKVFSPKADMKRWHEAETTKGEVENTLKEAERKLAFAELLFRQKVGASKGQKVHKTIKIRAYWYYQGFSRGDELVLQLATGQPPWALLWFRPGEEEPVCLSLAGLLPQGESLRQSLGLWREGIAVTSQGIWLRQPFGLVPWATLEGYLAPKEEASSKAAGQGP
jgi:hypothetical protein